MSDSQMSNVTGQALFQTQKTVGDGTTANGTNGVTFYTVGLDASLDLNMNVKRLELGRTGGTAGTYVSSEQVKAGTGINQVDILGKDVAFGCVADSGNNCVDSQSGTATHLKPVTLLRPYFQFAIKNDGSPTQRQVVGIRLGAQNISGPLSFGKMDVFSGYLSATANMTMLGMTDVAATCGYPSLTKVTPTYAGGCPGTYGGGVGGTGVNVFDATIPANSTTITETDGRYNVPYMLQNWKNNGGTSQGSLGLDNAQICSLSLCAELAQETVNFSSASTPTLNAVASGSRLTQALVLNPGLATLIDNVTNSLTINQCQAGALVCAGGSWFPALIRGPAANQFKDQVCTGLGHGHYTAMGGSCSDTTLNTSPLPYNLTNFHQVTVNSSNIGLSFQDQALSYPGYQGNMPVGWGLYLPNAFNLNVVQPAAVFTNNIANGSAGRGDLVNLPPVYDNCWGAAKFC